MKALGAKQQQQACARQAAAAPRVSSTRLVVRAQSGSNAGNAQPIASSSASGTSGSERPAGISVGGLSPTSPKGWERVKTTLLDAGVKLLSAQEVIFAKERGVPIIDVRPAADYAKSHIPGSYNVPFYQPIQGWEPIKVARRLGYAFFGVLNGTEVNPNFTAEASARLDPKLGGVLVCAIGGTLEASDISKRGTQSRSLIAAWQLVEAGYKNVSVMKGGVNEWVKSGREMEELEDE